MHHLSNSIWFPNPEEADKEGLLAVGGDLSVKRLIHAYRSGIFPWFDDYQPILWWSPDPRMIMFLDDFKVSKSLEKIIHKNKFTITYNTCFWEVIRNCSQIKREGQQGTWITSQMQEAYLQLYEIGLATSLEIWLDDELVGGLYGIDLIDKKVFCGESMFSKVSDASKVGFYYLVAQLKTKNYQLIDCQMYTAHLERFGAKEIPRNEFLKYLNR
ncbi:MAG: leucyl/phenylalanyl-tRNA--protein transferase [Flavobacteriaceae bacterium]|nr:leucyl/phenylalanyl-tRNA--protein transferase [Flavobacteriaceae bacterium]